VSQQVESTTAALLQLPEETAYSSFVEVFIICYGAEAPARLSSFLPAQDFSCISVAVPVIFEGLYGRVTVTLVGGSQAQQAAVWQLQPLLQQHH
jgi:hypothetical protein